MNYVFSILKVDVFNKVYFKNTWTKTEITFIAHLVSSGVCKLKCLVKLISQTQSKCWAYKRKKKKVFWGYLVTCKGSSGGSFSACDLSSIFQSLWCNLSLTKEHFSPSLSYQYWPLSCIILWTIFYGSSKSSVLCKCLIKRNFKDKWIVVI